MTQINVRVNSEILRVLLTSNGKDEAFAKLSECLLTKS